MIDLRPVLYVLGIFLVTLAIAMAVPISFDVRAHNADWQAFLFAMAVTGFFGILLVLTNKPAKENITFTPRQAFLLTGLAWIVIAAFAAIPFCASTLQLSFTDAYFEAMSGLTTTGSTVIVGLDTAPPGILIWRALLQWMGGVGIIVVALSVLPMLRVGGMQLFRSEASERSQHVPKIRQLASNILWVYFGLTALCMTGYSFGGMDWFDSLAHAMSTVATAGFSTRDSSFMFTHPFVQYNAVIFMLLAGLPFALMARACVGNWRALLGDEQVRGYIFFAVVSILVMALYVRFWVGLPPEEAFRAAAFSITTIITTTGFINADYTLWGPFALGMIFFLSCTGACAGSSSGGLKIYRFQILASIAMAQMRQLIHPNGVFVPHYNGKPLQPSVAASVLGFFFVFAITFTLVALAFMLAGEDFTTAMSGSIAMVANVGPGLGEKIGPTGTFKPLSDAATWIGSVAMLLGRLEFFTLLVLFMPSFWRR